MRVLHLVLLICLGVVLLPSTGQGLGVHVLNKFTCLNLDEKKPFPVKRISGYSLQKIPIEAVLFTTKKNKHICADPKLDWVKKAIEVLNKRKEAKELENK